MSTPIKWTEINDPRAFVRAFALARGSYQRDLILGRQNLSGSTLTGMARRCWGSRYKASRLVLLERLAAAGIVWSERRAAHGRRILVLGGKL